MTIGTMRGTGSTWNKQDVGKFKRLGRLGAWDYYTRDKDEFAAATRPADPQEVEPRPGEILLVKKTSVMDGGSRWEDVTYHIAFPVPVGTFQEKAAREERRRKSADRTPRPQDALALPGLRRREPVRLTLGPPSSDLSLDALKARTGAAAPAVAEVGGHEGVAHSPAGYLEWLAGRGIQVEVAKGHLLIKTSKPLGQEERILLDRAEGLLVGHLSGTPVSCVACDQPAASIAFPSAPVCSEHLEADR